MDLEVNDSRVGDPAEGITIGVSDGVPIQSPIYDDVTAITTIAARSGQTVVFGGLIQTNRTDTFRGVPYLSQLPVLGHLFRFDTHSDERTELIFFLTPHIVMDDADLEMLNQREAERMSWCLADIIEVHGDPGFAGGRGDPLERRDSRHLSPSRSDGRRRHPARRMMMDPGRRRFPRQFGRGAAAAASRAKQPFILPPEERSEGTALRSATGVNESRANPSSCRPRTAKTEPAVFEQRSRANRSADSGGARIAAAGAGHWHVAAATGPQSMARSGPLPGAATRAVVPAEYQQPVVPGQPTSSTAATCTAVSPVRIRFHTSQQ